MSLLRSSAIVADDPRRAILHEEETPDGHLMPTAVSQHGTAQTFINFNTRRSSVVMVPPMNAPATAMTVPILMANAMASVGDVVGNSSLIASNDQRPSSSLGMHKRRGSVSLADRTSNACLSVGCVVRDQFDYSRLTRYDG